MLPCQCNIVFSEMMIRCTGHRSRWIYLTRDRATVLLVTGSKERHINYQRHSFSRTFASSTESSLTLDWSPSCYSKLFFLPCSLLAFLAFICNHLWNDERPLRSPPTRSLLLRRTGTTFTLGAIPTMAALEWMRLMSP